MKNKGVYIFAFLLLLSAAACSSDYFEERQSLPEEGWTYDQKLSFSFEAPDTANQYDLGIDIQHSTEFPYQNIYVRLVTVLPSGDTIREPVSLNLADKFGNWQGNCAWGACDFSAPLQPKMYFREMGTYHLTFEQFTRKDTIKGIQSLGIHITPSAERRQQ